MRVFTGGSVEECLKKAAIDLKVDINDLEYEILEQKKTLFKKHFKIEVKIPLDEDIDGKVMISDGEIQVSNPKDGGRKATITPSKEIFLKVNEDEIDRKTSISLEDDIAWTGAVVEGKRELNVTISDDKTEAYIELQSIPRRVYGIKDSLEMTDLIVGSSIEEEIYPPGYSVEDILEVLTQFKITNGLLMDNIKNISKNNKADKLIVAQGIQPQDGSDDRLILKYNENKVPVKDKKGNVDFKSIGHICTIKSGEVLCELIKGVTAVEGKDVYGNKISANEGKKISVNAGKGCTFIDSKIIAVETGKPVKKGYTFSIEPVYVINGDVDVSTGDVTFDGNIEIFGEILDGMKVKSGKSVFIHSGASGAEIISENDISINGNVMTSNVSSGKDEVYKKKIFNALNNLHSTITELKNMGDQVYKSKMLGQNVKIGEVIKILIEKRFKKLEKNIQEYETLVESKSERLKLIASILKNKLTGLGIINLKNIDELDKILFLIKSEQEKIYCDEFTQSDIKLNYIQDSKIVSYGDVYINGKGEYISEIFADGNIYFAERSVARGGTLQARKEIKCSIVGSGGRVRTTLKVDKEGHIYIDKAFPNTKLIVGKMECIIEDECKDVHAYMNENGEIVVEKIKE
ncbi:flagellar assembly protein A [Oceanirhabdus seepicola]|nr:FapA family protein [Oceanirhabdus seepicola]